MRFILLVGCLLAILGLFTTPSHAFTTDIFETFEFEKYLPESVFTVLQQSTAFLKPDPDDIPITSDYNQPAGLRSKMIKTKFSCPGALCPPAYKLARSLPRFVGGKEWPASLRNGNFSHDDSVKYYAGVLSFGLGFPILLAFATLIAGIVWCLGRGCCNCCGGRAAKRWYTHADRLIIRVLVTVWLAFIFILCFFVIASSHAGSKGLNTAVQGTDNLFGIADDFVTELESISPPFTSRAASLEELTTAMSAFPNAGALATHNTCYDTQEAAMQAQITLVQDIEERNTELYTQELIDLSTQLSSIKTNLDSLKTFSTTNPLSDWGTQSQSTVDSLDRADFTSMSSDQVVLATTFSLGADIYMQLSNSTLLLQESLGPTLDESLIYQSVPDVLSVMDDFSHRTPYRSIIDALSISPLTQDNCNTLRPQLTTLISSLEVYNTLQTKLARSISDELIAMGDRVTISRNTSSSIEDRWKFIQTQLNSIFINKDTFITNYDTLSQSTWMKSLYLFDYKSLDAIDSILTAIDTTKTALSNAILFYGGSVSQSNNIDVSPIQNNGIDAVDNTIDPTESVQWKTLSDRIPVVPEIGICVSRIATTMSAGNEWFATVPPTFDFLVHAEAMLKAYVAEDATHAGSKKVSQNLIDALDIVSNGINKLQLSNTALSDISNAYTSQSSIIGASQRFSSLYSSLSNIQGVFNTYKVDLLGQLYDNLQLFDSIEVVNNSAQTIASGYNLLPSLDSLYSSLADEIKLSIDRNIIVELKAAIDQMGLCTGPISFNSSFNRRAVVRMMQRLLDITSSGPSETTTQGHITTINNAINAFTTISSQFNNLDSLITYTRVYSTVPASTDLTTVVYNGSNATTLVRGIPNHQALTTALTGLSVHRDTTITNLNDIVTACHDLTEDIWYTSTTPTPGDAYGDAVISLQYIRQGISLPTYSGHLIAEFPYLPLLTSSTEFTSSTTNPMNTGLRVKGYLHILSRVLENRPDIVAVQEGMAIRIGQLKSAVDQINTKVSQWGNTRTTIKREGYLADQQRLIITDIAMSLVLCMVFVVTVATWISFHRTTLFCTLLLSPLVPILFLISGAHFLPGVASGDFCRDPHGIVGDMLGNQNVNVDLMQGIQSFITSDTVDPTNIRDLYSYFAVCVNEPVPGFLAVLRDASEDSFNLPTDQLDDFRQEANDQIDDANQTQPPNGQLVMAPRLVSLFDSLQSITGEAVVIAHNMFNIVECSNIQPQMSLVVDTAVCKEVTEAVSLVGILTFLIAICLFPGLFCGCRAFKVVNSQNNIKYRTVAGDANRKYSGTRGNTAAGSTFTGGNAYQVEMARH